MPDTEKRRPLRAFFIVLGLIFVLYIMHRLTSPSDPGGTGRTVGEEMIAFCRGSPEKVADVLQRARSLSVIESGVGSEHVEIDETVWALLPHDAKVSVALAAWCRVPGIGPRGSVYLFGFRDGDIHASVIAGNYSD